MPLYLVHAPALIGGTWLPVDASLISFRLRQVGVRYKNKAEDVRNKREHTAPARGH
jgi:hypothetical protein